MLCMFMTNFKFVGKKEIKFWLFYILCVLCPFGIKKSEKKYFLNVTLELCNVPT